MGSSGTSPANDKKWIVQMIMPSDEVDNAVTLNAWAGECYLISNLSNLDEDLEEIKSLLIQIA